MHQGKCTFNVKLHFSLKRARYGSDQQYQQADLSILTYACLDAFIIWPNAFFKIPVIPDSMNSEVTVLLMTLPNACFPCLVSIVNCLVIHC